VAWGDTVIIQIRRYLKAVMHGVWHSPCCKQDGYFGSEWPSGHTEQWGVQLVNVFHKEKIGHLFIGIEGIEYAPLQ
jgi:hypothetical protein